VIAILFAPLAASARTLTAPELRGDPSRRRMSLGGGRDLPVAAEGRDRVLSTTDAMHTTDAMKNARVRTLELLGKCSDGRGIGLRCPRGDAAFSASGP